MGGGEKVEFDWGAGYRSLKYVRRIPARRGDLSGIFARLVSVSGSRVIYSCIRDLVTVVQASEEGGCWVHHSAAQFRKVVFPSPRFKLRSLDSVEILKST